MLSSLSLQAAALQARSQVSAGQRLRQAEDGLMSAAQHLLARSISVDQLAARVGETGQVGPVAYRLLLVEGPSWQDSTALGEPQRGRLVLTLQQLATAASVDEGLRALAAVDAAAAQALQHQVATAVEQRSAAYLARHGDRVMRIGAVLFDRSRRLCAEGPSGSDLLQAFRARDLG